ncbi:MAG TPA: hypothetical protein DIS90_04865 [Cytophagales bacterium]|nr:hypothetical protein [Cytophagales bacterium]HCR54439.1 hypothetical protein [Cytophagales bacterium]
MYLNGLKIKLEMKMKNFIILFALISFMSCTDFDIEDQGLILEDLPSYVAFKNDGGTITPIVKNVAENTTSAASRTVTVECPTGTLSDITVSYSFSGSAVYGTDFTIAGATAAGGTVIIKQRNGDNNDFDFGNIVVTLLTDAVADGTKDLIITLTSAVNADGQTFAVGRGGTDVLRSATFNISNVDLTLSFASSSASLTEGGKEKTALVVVSNFAAPEDVTISLATQGDAVLGTDFTYKSGNPLPATVTLLKGKTSVSIDTLLSVNDDLKEAKDSIQYTLSGATIAGAGNTVKIGTAKTFVYKVKDDIKRITMERVKTDTVRITSINQTGPLLLPVSMSSSSQQSISIGYNITGGTPGVDYVDSSGGTIVFAPGQTKANINLTIPSGAVSGGVKKINVKLNAATLLPGSDTEVEVVATTNLESNIKIGN